jgi:ABC-type Fe3+-siderophore transport system permease subunit
MTAITANPGSVVTAERKKRPWAIGVGSLVAALAASLGTLTLVVTGMSWTDGFKYVTGGLDADQNLLIDRYILPRVALCWMVGIALAMSGGVLQAIVRNPLAAPDIIGVTKGAGAMAIITVTVFPAVPLIVLPIAAFAGGILATLVVYLFAYRNGSSPVRLALVGVAVSAACEGVIRCLLVLHPLDVNTALSWLTGSMFGRTASNVWQFLPWLVVLAPLLLWYSRRLDTLGLGDDLATGLGEPVERTRRITLLLAVALASAAVAVAGTVGFVGLMAPHAARRLVGGKHAALLPTAGALGALLMVVADAIGRGALPPLEIPVGLVTALIGGPYFLYLLTKTGK